MLDRMTPTRIRLLRKRLNQTQVRMAHLLDVSLSHWRNFERGRAPLPRLHERVIRLLDQGRITVADLEPRMPPRPPYAPPLRPQEPAEAETQAGEDSRPV